MPADTMPTTDPQSANLYDAAVGGALRSLVNQFGVSLLGEAGRLRGLLQDECPQAKREISVLMQALDERVPQDLLRVHSGEPIGSLSPRLAKRLTDEKSMSPVASRWAVSTWAHGLGIGAALGDHPEFLALDDVARDAANDRSVAIPPSDIVPPAPKPPSRGNWVLAAGAVLAIAAAGWFGLMQPKLVINSVDTDGPFAGDGQPHAVLLRYTARNDAVQRIESQFVRGDGTWDTKPASYDVAASGGTPTPGQASAGTLAYTTTQPMSATFAYVLIGRDGKRSAPFEHTFNIVPPPQITDVTVPRALHVGEDFAVKLTYARGGSDIVKVERHVISSNVPWAQSDAVQTTQLADVTGSFNYAFGAARQPLHSTVEFVIEDAQGIRSEPKRVTLSVGTLEPSTPAPAGVRGSPATVLAVQAIRTPGKTTGLGAAIGGVIGGLLGSRFGHGNGRVATTVVGAGGGALAGHVVEANTQGESNWQTTVRFDDGTTGVFSQIDAPRWKVGDRVHVINGVVRAR